MLGRVRGRLIHSPKVGADLIAFSWYYRYKSGAEQRRTPADRIGGRAIDGPSPISFPRAEELYDLRTRSIDGAIGLGDSLTGTRTEGTVFVKGNLMEHAVQETTASARQRAAQPTIGGSVYVKPQEIAWEPTQFDGISIKVLYEDKAKGEMTCLLKWEAGATLPMHKHPEIEQTYVIEGSFYDHDGICRAGEFVWRRVGSFHETHSDEGAVILAVYRKPNVFQASAGYAHAANTGSSP